MSELVVRDGLMALADRIEPFFPLHAKAIRDEMTHWTLRDDGTWEGSPRKMTDSRWNRVADIICSLAALPGHLFSVEARHARLEALCRVEAPRAMARHYFGGQRAEGALELAEWLMEQYVVCRVDHG